MSLTPSVPLPYPVIVTTLRAAGCVFAEDEAELILETAASPEQLTAMVEQRVLGLPLEHVLGWASFHGLRISVGPGVFVPRRRTEFLVDVATTLTSPGALVVDLCCGAGALGAALAAAVSGVRLHATDVDPAAVASARRNIPPAVGQVYQGDLFDPLPTTLRGRIDTLLANVPYVPTREIELLPAEARVHEARVALDGGADGLDVLRRVAAAAPDWLAPGGRLLFETSERQVPDAVDVVTRAGLAAEVRTDEEMDATVVVAINCAIN
ncbi:putative protein N(5)-glutamine methyltransferase [Kitasatospora kifunensis]|uniref:peptide chain release factor N(5)-glutamine methyltransferase n=1 Tax=Kitasatospora kifunensis TaxID=58351 RepID=A0A7W7R679_KITKI|nr:putative protein N(5)-glutamine methyltransferase [Kitasatospora kifunensis]MBB4925898.1 release factor glutamine methyltransferase [Kitasatospora kifunensis]